MKAKRILGKLVRSNRARVAALVMLCLLVAGAAAYLSVGRWLFFARDFATVRTGMSRAEVVRVLGDPNEESEHFRLSQREGYESAYQEAERSSSKYYLVWYRWIDQTYTVGFDDQDRVTIAASGGT